MHWRFVSFRKGGSLREGSWPSDPDSRLVGDGKRSTVLGVALAFCFFLEREGVCGRDRARLTFAFFFDIFFDIVFERIFGRLSVFFGRALGSNIEEKAIPNRRLNAIGFLKSFVVDFGLFSRSFSHLNLLVC